MDTGRWTVCATAALVAAGLAYVQPNAAARADRTASTAAVDSGWIAGSVHRAADGVPLRYASVTAVGTLIAALADSMGTFLMHVPAGVYTVRAMMMMHRTGEVAEVVITPNDTTRIAFHLDPEGLSDADARAESIGVDIHVTADDLRCEIVPLRQRFVVGDRPKFGVRIYNESDQTFFLVPVLDGSERGTRYPNIEWLVEGPDGGVKRAVMGYCGNVNSLRPADFVHVEPGGEFDPYRNADFTDMERAVTFVRPGRYTVRFRYSTDEGDIRRWLGDWARAVDPVVSERIRRVPRVVLTATTTIDVEE